MRIRGEFRIFDTDDNVVVFKQSLITGSPM